MTEFALVVPVLLILIMGVLDGALLMFSVGTARYAAAEGSRVAATLGNVSNTDSQVVTTIRQTVGSTQLFTVEEIDIYKLNQQANGTLTVAPGTINSYNLDGTPIGSTPWPSSSRDVKNGESDFLGVTIYYRYNWKTGLFLFAGPLDLNQSFAIRLEPQTY